MADNKITEYNSHAAPATGDQFFMIGASEEYRIDYDALANAILNKLTSKTYSGINNNLIDAIAALNSKLRAISPTLVAPAAAPVLGMFSHLPLYRFMPHRACFLLLRKASALPSAGTSSGIPQWHPRHPSSA